MGDPLTESGQFTLRSELRNLMWIAKIASPDALYGATASARTFETIDWPIVNPIDFDGIVDVGAARVTGAGNYPHVPGFEEYGRKFKMGGKRDEPCEFVGEK